MNYNIKVTKVSQQSGAAMEALYCHLFDSYLHHYDKKILT